MSNEAPDPSPAPTAPAEEVVYRVKASYRLRREIIFTKSPAGSNIGCRVVAPSQRGRARFAAIAYTSGPPSDFEVMFDGPEEKEPAAILIVGGASGVHFEITIADGRRIVELFGVRGWTK